MPQLKGKQIKDGTITDAKVDASIIVADGSNPFSGDQAMGGNKLTGLADGVASADAVNKSQLDAIAAGVSWRDPAAVNGYHANLTIAGINGLTPAKGDAVVATDAGTPTAGTSDALAAGDLAEFDGTSWKLIVANSGGFVPVGTRAIISTVATLTTPLTPATDEGKIAVFDGISNTPTFITLVDGDALLDLAAADHQPLPGHDAADLPVARAVDVDGELLARDVLLDDQPLAERPHVRVQMLFIADDGGPNAPRTALRLDEAGVEGLGAKVIERQRPDRDQPGPLEQSVGADLIATEGDDRLVADHDGAPGLGEFIAVAGQRAEVQIGQRDQQAHPVLADEVQ